VTSLDSSLILDGPDGESFAGWHVPPEENFGRALAGTYFSLAARDPEGRLIGYGRVVSDAAAQTTLPGCFFTFCPTRCRR
jgi:hypothetical protein